MKRLFWMGLGAAVAVAGARKARRTLGPFADAAAPVSAFLARSRASLAEFRETMAEQEAVLHAAFVEDGGGPDRPRTDPRRPARPSWLHPEDDDEPYSF